MGKKGVQTILAFLFLSILLIAIIMLYLANIPSEEEPREEKASSIETNKIRNVSHAQEEKYQTGEIQVMVKGFAPAEYSYYWLYVPENYTPDVAWPLIVDLHGRGKTGVEYAHYMLEHFWEPIARKRSYIVVNPQSRARGWSIRPYGGKGPDSDLTYILHIVKEVMNGYRIDKNRILLTGSSVGGDFVYPVCILNQDLFSHCVSFIGGLFIDVTKPSFYNFIITEEEMEKAKDNTKLYILTGELDKPRIANNIYYRDYFTKRGFNVTFFIIPDTAHEIPKERYREQVLDWFENDTGDR